MCVFFSSFKCYGMKLCNLSGLITSNMTPELKSRRRKWRSTHDCDITSLRTKMKEFYFILEILLVNSVLILVIEGKYHLAHSRHWRRKHHLVESDEPDIEGSTEENNSQRRLKSRPENFEELQAFSRHYKQYPDNRRQFKETKSAGGSQQIPSELVRRPWHSKGRSSLTRHPQRTGSSSKFKDSQKHGFDQSLSVRIDSPLLLRRSQGIKGEAQDEQPNDISSKFPYYFLTWIHLDIEGTI